MSLTAVSEKGEGDGGGGRANGDGPSAGAAINQFFGSDVI